jgi:hypothetical protein
MAICLRLSDAAWAVMGLRLGAMKQQAGGPPPPNDRLSIAKGRAQVGTLRQVLLFLTRACRAEMTKGLQTRRLDSSRRT